MAEIRKSTSFKAAAKRSPPSPAPAGKRRKRNVSTFLQGDVTLTDKAYAQIEELIVTLQLPPGTVLSELVLADRLGIGRTPIREALQRLSRDGLVNILPRRGVLVSEIDLRAQLRLLEVRRELERLMARAAAERASEEERAQFSEIAAGMRRASDQEDDISFMRLDQQFNTLVSLTARNEFASRSMGLMHGLSRRFWYQHYKEAADLPLCARLHAAVAEAIARRDPNKAAEASDKLVDYIESFARSTL
jgi:DNA-binding GntR family transcriptional regulator